MKVGIFQVYCWTHLDVGHMSKCVFVSVYEWEFVEGQIQYLQILQPTNFLQYDEVKAIKPFLYLGWRDRLYGILFKPKEVLKFFDDSGFWPGFDDFHLPLVHLDVLCTNDVTKKLGGALVE